jgi:hypothetical protein
MKILKISGLIILVVIILICVAGAFMPKEFHFEGKQKIKSSRDIAWSNVVDLRNHDKWSQWHLLDPKMQIGYSGDGGQVGSKMMWVSKHPQVGNGTQTITGIDGKNRVNFDVDFEGKGSAKSYLVVNGDSSQCAVIWGLDIQAPYPMNAIMGMMMNKQMMDDMFTNGLGLLKDVCEKEESAKLP